MIIVITRFCLFTFACIFTSFCTASETVEYSVRLIQQDHGCNMTEEPTFSRPVRSKIDCMITCLQIHPDSRLCYDTPAKLCTCCSYHNDTRSTTVPSGLPSTECYDAQNIVECPGRWTLINNTCFVTHSQQIPFDVCQSFCEVNGGKVMTLANDEQTLVAETYLSNHPGPNEYGISWLGMVLDTTGEWRYIETGEIVTFFSWGLDEPDGFQKEPPETCSALGYNVTSHWMDVPCDWSFSCVCTD